MRVGLHGLVVCLWVTVAVAARAEETPLMPTAMASWSIVCPTTASESERYAAHEFQTLFEQMTGAKLPLVDQKPADGHGVFIGPDAVALAGGAPPTQDLGEEGLRITVEPTSIQIDGGRPRGTLYGVYEFFEELCGVRYLTFDHTYFPESAPTRPLPLGTRVHIPTFAFRWAYCGEATQYPEFATRLHTNTVSDDPKLGGRTSFRLVFHNVAQLLPPDKYGASHPEYYALVDGERKLTMFGGGPQVCASNPEVTDRITEAVLEEIAKNPTTRNFSIAQMDNNRFCQCDACAAIDAREESHAGALLSLVNAVAERIEKTHPEVLLGTLAYEYTRKAPKTLRARPNVLVQLCSIECCNLHAIDDPGCPLNRPFCEDLAAWKAKADHLFLWYYTTNFRGYLLPYPNLRSIGPSVDYFANNHGRGVFMQGPGNATATEMSDLRHYVISRCLWKPGRDSWQEAEEFCRLHYREAAPEILAYLRDFHAHADSLQTHIFCFPTEGTLSLTPAVAQTVRGHFDRALALAQSEEVRTRVEKASIAGLAAAVTSVSARARVEEGVYQPAENPFEPELPDRFEKLCARYGATLDDEGVTVTQRQTERRQLWAGLKAVTLENATWRLAFLPESNGKMVEMIYKPTGRDLIASFRAQSRFHVEEWVLQGEGPSKEVVLPCDITIAGDSARLLFTTPEGTRFQRQITLTDEAIRFETTMTAGVRRPCQLQVRYEYDTATRSTDPRVLQIFVKTPQWIQINRDWHEAMPTEAQTLAVRQAAAGGAFAYYNAQERFGVEQRFDPQDFVSFIHHWTPPRLEVALEMVSQLRELEPGEATSYRYEIRYLHEPPRTP